MTDMRFGHMMCICEAISFSRALDGATRILIGRNSFDPFFGTGITLYCCHRKRDALVEKIRHYIQDEMQDE